MAITETRSWRITGARADVQEQLSNAVRELRGEVVALDPFAAKTGGFWKTRLIGAIFLSSKDLPTNIRVDLREENNGITADATVSDRFGFGIRTGVVSRFRTQCLRVLDALQSATTGSVDADDLRELKRLLDEGVITDQEYEAKRRGLVERL